MHYLLQLFYRSSSNSLFSTVAIVLWNYQNLPFLLGFPTFPTFCGKFPTFRWRLSRFLRNFPLSVRNFREIWEITQHFSHFRDILDSYLVFFRSEVDAKSPTELQQTKNGRVWGTVEKIQEEMAPEPVKIWLLLIKSKSGKIPTFRKFPKKMENARKIQ